MDWVQIRPLISVFFSSTPSAASRTPSAHPGGRARRSPAKPIADISEGEEDDRSTVADEDDDATADDQSVVTDDDDVDSMLDDE